MSSDESNMMAHSINMLVSCTLGFNFQSKMICNVLRIRISITLANYRTSFYDVNPPLSLYTQQMVVTVVITSSYWSTMFILLSENKCERVRLRHIDNSQSLIHISCPLALDFGTVMKYSYCGQLPCFSHGEVKFNL